VEVWPPSSHGVAGEDGPDVAVPDRVRTQGRLDQPGQEATVAPFKVTGWALASGTSIATVEILVDGRSAGHARLGLARPDIARRTGHRDGPVCGFEHLVAPTHVPPSAESVAVSAIAQDLRGRRFVLGAMTVRVARPPSREDSRRRGRQLREGTRRLCRGPALRRPGGTRLLAVTHGLEVGGAQLWLYELLSRLAGRPGTAIAVASPTDGPLRASLEANGIPVHVAGELPVRSVDEYEGWLARLAAWGAPQGFDVALVNTAVAFPAIEVSALLGIPSVFAIHESVDMEAYWAWGYPRVDVHPYIRERARRAIGAATAVVFVAEATRRLHVRHGDPARFLTLPYGIELERVDRFRETFDREAARQRLGLPPEATVVLCLGSIEPRKGQACLAQAFGAIAGDHPDAVLALVGESGIPHFAPYVDAVREYARRGGLGPRVLVAPLVDDPYEWHGLADLLVCASDIESLPRVVVEAMVFDVPVLATRIFGLPELIEDGSTGWLCEPRDVASLAAALDGALAAGPQRRRRVGRQGGRVVRARHEPVAYAERMARLLEGLAQDPRADPAALVAG
jgi:D-inositol-3-phosphate glycosyltransferase